MKVISSRSTFFLKKVFPVLWLGIIASSIAMMVAVGAAQKVPVAVVGPVFMLVVGGVLFRKLLWDLADEVRDGGDFLVVRRGSVEERIALADIMNVSITQFVNPQRLSLRLRRPGKFGDEVVFVPVRQFSFNPMARNPVAEDLIRRIDRARTMP